VVTTLGDSIMTKTTTSYVMIDQSYGHMEDWVKVKVIERTSFKNWFTGEDEDGLIVELPSKEHIAVNSWKNLEA
jgi:hypothetical protein